MKKDCWMQIFFIERKRVLLTKRTWNANRSFCLWCTVVCLNQINPLKTLNIFMHDCNTFLFQELKNQLGDLKDTNATTVMDQIHAENVKQGRDKYKTLKVSGGEGLP